MGNRRLELHDKDDPFCDDPTFAELNEDSRRFVLDTLRLESLNPKTYICLRDSDVGARLEIRQPLAQIGSASHIGAGEILYTKR